MTVPRENEIFRKKVERYLEYAYILPYIISVQYAVSKNYVCNNLQSRSKMQNQNKKGNVVAELNCNIDSMTF